MEELMKFNPFNVCIEFNPHKGTYGTIEDYYIRESFLDYEECLKQDRVFAIRVYPDTPVGFYDVCASDYQTALNWMCEVLKNDRESAKK